MTCGHDRDSLLLYAADGFAEGEEVEAEARIAACRQCATAFGEAQNVWAAIGLALTPRSAPAAVKDRLFSAVEQWRPPEAPPSLEVHGQAEVFPAPAFRGPGRRAADRARSAASSPRSSRWHYGLTMAAGVVLGAGGMFLYLNQQLADIDTLQARIAQFEADQTGGAQSVSAQLLDWIKSPAVQVISLKSPGENDPSSGRMLWNADQHVARFFGSQLPQTGGAGPYRLWLVTAKGERVDAGTFKLDKKGTANFEFTLPKNADAVAQIHITRAASTDSTQPASEQPLLAGAWPQSR